MFDARSIWLAMAAFVLVALGWRALSPPPAPDTAPFAVVPIGHGAALTYEKVDRARCVGTGDRLWLTHADGFDCVTVFAPSAADRTGDTAIVFLDGDVPVEDQTSSGETRLRGTYQRMAQSLTDRFKLPVYVIARPGLLGSSGTHSAGGRRDESFIIDAALEEMKRTYGMRTFVMAGQSGGARIIAQLLVLGRRDIACGVMGSGAYDVPRLRSGERTYTNIFGDPGRRYLVPMRQLGDVPNVPTRRLFVIGDPADTVTPFPEQKSWAEALDRLGHHVVLIEAKAEGASNHGLAEKALAAAGACAQGKSDADIVEAAGRRAIVR
jgi:hypothetical protein